MRNEGGKRGSLFLKRLDFHFPKRKKTVRRTPQGELKKKKKKDPAAWEKTFATKGGKKKGG